MKNIVILKTAWLLYNKNNGLCDGGVTQNNNFYNKIYM